MKRHIIGLIVLATVLFVFGTAFAQEGAYQLQEAKTAMERGDFRYAISRFTDISRNSYYSRPIVKEAAYYIGFCYVKMSDPWNAIQAYESFLDRFDNSSYDRSFIPDAMYVLGRTYEETRNNEKAAAIYRRCIDRFPSNEFSDKSRDRLRMIGGGSHHGGDHYSDVTPQVRDLVELAKMSPNDYTRNDMLLNASRKARTGADYLLILSAVTNEFTKSQILDNLKGSSIFPMLTAREVVNILRYTSNSYFRDDCLLAAARKCAHSAADFRILMDATNNSFTKQQILEIAQKVLGRDNPSFSISLSMEAAPVSDTKIAPMTKATKAPKASVAKKPSKVDPFEGFKLDQAKIDRVSRFLEAVKTRTGIEDAAKKLAKEDSSMDVVKSALKDSTRIKQFETLHETNK